MRFVVVALVSVATTLAGCSSSPPPAATQSDAGDEYRALGQSCDPTSPHPCEVLTDGCSASMCQAQVCVRVFVDAGPTCSNGSPPSYDAGGGEDAGAEDASREDASREDAGLRGDASSDAGDAAAPVDASDGAAGDAEADASFDASGE